MSTATVHISPVPDFFVFSDIEVVAVLHDGTLGWVELHNHRMTIAASSFWSIDTVHQGLVASGYDTRKYNSKYRSYKIARSTRALFVRAKELLSREYIVSVHWS
ncbi:hypothetical protein EDD18DRAFT_1327601 [Armillaria luteobubalina]|uniref:Uncharacterized protein n=1 Tax=Armillaria luteobubalina TaxID=153913 RepID=A0AA39QIZ4_9AGAR|nr:hypothetical protein EDD18DRAFT_1327601 [Armillaria luteobubalina]